MSLRLICRACVGLYLLCAVSTACCQDFTQLVDRGIELQESGHFREAVNAYEAALRIGDPRDINYETACANLGLVYAVLGQLDRAEAMLTNVLANRQARLDPNDESIGEAVGHLSNVYFMQNKHDQALKGMKRQVDIYRRHYPVEDRRLLAALEGLINQYFTVNQNTNARALTDDTLAQLEARVGSNDSRLQGTLLLLARALMQVGSYREADKAIQRARRLPAATRDKPAGNEMEPVLAGLYQSMGRPAEALEQLRSIEKDLPARVSKMPFMRPLIYANWEAQGEVLLELGQLDEAIRLLQAASDAKAASKEPPSAISLEILAKAYHRTGQVDKAEALYRRLIADTNAAPGNRAQAGNLLASILMSQGKAAEPEHWLLNGIKHCEKYQMLETKFCASTRRLLGELYLTTERLVDAETQFRAALAILDKCEGQHYAEQSATWIGLAQVYEAQHKLTEAFQAADESRRHLHELTVKVLPVLMEPEQLMFLANEDGPCLQKALALVRMHADDQQAVELSASWILNRKGMAQQVIAERLLLSRDAQDPALASLVDDWVAVRHQLARVGAGNSSDKNGSQQNLIDQLTQREQELARELGRAKVRQAEPAPWQELSHFRQTLPKDCIYVDLVRYTPVGAGAKATYMVWLVPPKDQGKVQLIDLGSAAEVDAAIDVLRRRLNEIPNQLRSQRGLSPIEESQPAPDQDQFRQSLDRVGEKLLQPLLPTLTKFEHWIICPDGAPWLVPWSALPLTTGKQGKPRYVVEKHRISFTTSGRDLLDTSSPVSGNPALVLADPDFDHAPENSAPPAQPRFARDLATRSAGKVSGSWAALPGTAQESRLLAPALSKYTKHEPQMYLHAQASEATFKAAWRPRVAVLSTHGFFLVPTPLELAGGKGPQNPLLRCGLVLSGANHTELRTKDAQDDGIVTGLDVLETDLRGTELVVLSACETAVGQVNASEGVAGLRQAFQLSGARSVAATLWRIPDAETAILMKTFFEKLAGGADKAAALQQAQQAMLTSRGKSESDTSHPFYWAAFTLTGDWRVPQVGAEVPRPARRQAQSQVEVVVNSARLMKGEVLIKNVARGERLTRATDGKGDWIEVFYEPGTTKTAWIHKNNVREMH